MNTAEIPKGIQSLFQVRWTLRLETPLCIKSGQTSAFGSGTGNKTRNRDMTFQWNREKSGQEAQVSELRSELRFVQGSLVPVYSIPASSLRGALRSCFLRCFVEEKFWSPLCDAEEEANSQSMEELRAALAESASPGLALLRDCFGMALDTGNDTGNNTGKSPVGQKGKIRVQVFPLENPAPFPCVQGNDWKKSENDFGPDNAPRHISVRGPVDRITHGAKDGGLHYFMEFSPGQEMDVCLRIRNPKTLHLGLTALWEREISTGMLRLGGLTSAGRGRMRVVKKSHLVYAPPDREAELKKMLGEGITEETVAEQEIFSGIWKCFRVHNAKDFIPELAACIPGVKIKENRSCTL